ncbi:SpoIIE family protein phosphatase [Streptomyces sp. SCSIO ZS0520]|uniref:SpoIIE family protein phosphatase n=1 Tax=Streptomyces sp. SCSIO ZS0520 TaxID=2892996 RepID=UPI0021DB0A31|nr:SpoIIE family protein phosphatase [Streptomyces sp. SCSIO ZS0520]
MRTLAGQVFLVEMVIVLLLVAAGVAALVLQARSTTTVDARRVTRGVAESFAHSPGLVAALDSRDPSAALQPRTEAVRKATGVDSVVILRPDYLQLTSPDPAYIGRPYTPPPEVENDVVPKLRAGRTVTFSFDEPGYEAIATAVPVFGPNREPKGAVVANIAVERVDAVVNSNLPVLLGGAAGAVALAAAGTALASRRLLRQTRGLGPADMTRLYEHHHAVLHAVREGVLIIGGDGRLILANDEARRLLDLPRKAERRRVDELGLDPATVRLLLSDEETGEITDGVHAAGDRLLAVNKRPTAPYGGFPGSVVTLRDSTELYELTGRVEAAGQRRQLLYEAGAGIGTTLDTTRTCEELAAVAVPRFADIVAVDLLEEVARGEDPEGTGLRRLRRAVLHGAREGEALSPVGARVPLLAAASHGQDAGEYGPEGEAEEERQGAAENGRAGPADNGRAPAVGPGEPGEPAAGRGAAGGAGAPDAGRRRVPPAALSVPLRVRGTALGEVTFWRREGTAPFDEEDRSLAGELAARTAVSLDNARRYSREHDMAVTLQRSLLPSVLPEQTALDLAHRYLPAEAGVGGDWFDVITLPGFRTALVVGDVVGHGIHAAVAMGRLRTAVHNFATLDLPPDEVLGRLDELVDRLDSESSGAQITGSTCLYAVYEPISGICTMARAGHPGPALVLPDGSAEYPEVTVSPPLGVGGHPFEVTELRLRAGSQLVLFSDGLVESRTRDLGRGLDQLRTVLTEAAGAGPEGLCRAAVARMLDPRPTDDVALLVARTRLLDPGQVAEWEVPADPAEVAPLRAACLRRLAEWGLEEHAFTTELLLSELLTNAIRYGDPPVRVRLLRAATLVCEVSDASSTSPHLRWAATTDEGGRGIFLVAQLAHRWGTRYTPSGGKVIWAEQVLQGPGTGTGTGTGAGT